MSFPIVGRVFSGVVISAAIAVSAIRAADVDASRQVAAEELYSEVVAMGDLEAKFREIGDSVMVKFKSAPAAAQEEGRRLVDDALHDVMQSYHSFFVQFYSQRFTAQELTDIVYFIRLSKSPSVAKFKSAQSDFRFENDKVGQEMKKMMIEDLKPKVMKLLEKYR